MSNEIANYLKYANLQMAAESLFGVLPTDAVELIKGPGSMTQATLFDGNNRASKFTLPQAKQFLNDDKWTVVEHKSNTATGFSGTLFKNSQTNEYVMSFRSTEFADDAARDNQATNTMEIKEKGWAFGQIADMESWYASLKASASKLGNNSFTVTGYSLGGHLATAFSILRREEQRQSGTPNPIINTYTINGAGVGTFSGTLGSAMGTFVQHRSTGTNASLFTTSAAQTLYSQFKTSFQANSSQTTKASAEAALNQLTLPMQLATGTGLQELLLLQKAMRRISDLAGEIERVNGGIPSGTGAPAATPTTTNKIEAIGLDYQLAVLKASESTSSTRTVFDGIGVVAYAGREVAADRIANLYDLYGDTSPSGVANSQIHYGTGTPIWIEDQPLFRGSVISSVAIASGLGVLAADLKLLVPGFSQNDFGDTHSLVLLQDSLSVQNTLAQLDPNLSLATLKTILTAASNAKVDTSPNNQGKADGDTLEYVVNALTKAFGVLGGPLSGNLDGNTWAEIGARTELHTRLAAIQTEIKKQHLEGQVLVRASTADLRAAARFNFGALLALADMSPFYLTGQNPAAQAILDNAWQGSRGTEYAAWLADRGASSPTSYTDKWIEDRAGALGAIMERNKQNLAQDQVLLSNQVVDYTVVNAFAADTKLSVRLQNSTGGPTAEVLIKQVKFGGDSSDPFDGKLGDDHLYGGGGNDTLKGFAGKDYLEGGAGADNLQGGLDFDTYQADNQDTITDTDGKGVVRLGATALGRATRKKGETDYKDRAGNIYVQADTTLTINNGLQIVKWVSGDLGITLVEEGNGPDGPGGGGATPPIDPLALDLDGDGIETTSTQDGPLILFDHDADNIKTGTGWLKPDDAWLALDRNGNGSIDNGRELFGVGTLKSNGYLASDGFDALQDLDANQDGKIDATDSVFANLRIWRDLNQDGISQAGELTSLDASGITSIGVNASGVRHDLGNGNMQTAAGTFTRANGTTGATAETTGLAANLNLLNNTYYREFTDSIALTEQAQALPDLHGSGQVRDLSQAISLSTDLGNWVQTYTQQSTRQAQVNMLDGFIERWANTSNLKSLKAQADALATSGVRLTYSLEGLTAGTAAYEEFVRNVGVVERFMGFTYGGAFGQARLTPLDAGSGNVSVRLSQGQIANIALAYDRFKTEIYELLLPQTRMQSYQDALRAAVLDAPTQGSNAFQGLETAFKQAIAANPRDGFIDLIEFISATGSSNLAQYGWDATRFSQTQLSNNTSDLGAFSEELYNWTVRFGSADVHALNGSAGSDWLVGSAGDDGIQGFDGDDILHGAAGDDSLAGGDGDDNLHGAAGNDSLSGGNGNDSLDGGAGNDTLNGGTGNNTYLFGKGDGQDVVTNLSDATPGKLNTLQFKPGVLASEVRTTRSPTNLMLSIAGTTDIITLQNFLYANDSNNSYNPVQQVKFADGTSWDLKKLLDTYLSGTAGDDELSGTSSDDLIQGQAGNDILYGGAGNDTLLGGDGNDTLHGYDGNDVFNGGKGNDLIFTTSGADTVLFDLGDGQDTVSRDPWFVHTPGESITLRLGANIARTDVVALREGASLVLNLKGSQDSVTIQGYFGHDPWTNQYFDATEDAYSPVQQIRFADGSELTPTVGTIGIIVHSTTGGSLPATDNADRIFGSALDETVQAGGGDDEIHGGDGNDSLNGDGGNDTIYGGGGDDWIWGDNGDDWIDGGAGNDLLLGFGNTPGSDTYVFGRGYGNDWINNERTTGAMETDTLFLSGLNPNEVKLERLATTAGYDSLMVRVINTTDSIEIFKYFQKDSVDGTNHAIDQIRFANGTIWDRNAILAQVPVVNMTINGTAADETLTGGAGDDTLFGMEGSDTLIGGEGADVLVGGLGEDVYYVDNVGDVVQELANEGYDVVMSYVDFVLPENVEDLNVSALGRPNYATGNIALTGNSLNNIIVGTEGDNVIDGRGGSDQMDGQDGNDTYYVDNVGDRIGESSGVDKVVSIISWSLVSGLENLVLSGSSNINGTGNAQDNTLIGNSGNNTLTGNAGADTLDGGAGTDTLKGGNGADTYLFGRGYGIDTIINDDTDALGTNADTIQLGANITPTDIVVGTVAGTNGATLSLKISGTTDELRVQNYFASNGSTSATVENIRFANGTVWNYATVLGKTPVADQTLNGTANADTLNGGAGNDTLNGLGGNDTLNGLAGNDTLDGGTGNDTMKGGLGDDTYIVDSTSDVVTENLNEGTDLVKSSVTLTLANNVENLTLTGNSAINGTGNALANTLTGNIGANTLDGGAGADTLIGGAGNDTYVVDNIGDVVTEKLNEGTDLVKASVNHTLTANVENLTLTGTANLNGTGNTLANTLTGNAGANVLDGGAGADTMVGGAGNDTYYVDHASDATTEAASAGTDLVMASLNWILATNLENLTLTGTSNINATGNTVTNVLTGNGGDNVLDGGTGADTLIGGLGNDTYVVDNTSDVVTEALNAGTDLVKSNVTIAQLAANVENLALTGTTAINATGNALDNVLTGNSAANVLTGGAGNDTYVVGAGDSTIEVAGGGTDIVQSAITWSLASTVNVENLTLTGSSAVNGTGNTADNVLTGNSAVNTLTGNAGNDTLDGKGGADILVGGTGNDTYWLGRGYGFDSVTENDTTAGNTDVARFDATVANDQLWFSHVGNNLEVSIIGTSDKLTMTNWYLGNQYHVEQFKTSNGKTLLDSQVQNLVSAMAAFSPPAAGQTTLPANYATSLSPVIVANWQ